MQAAQPALRGCGHQRQASCSGRVGSNNMRRAPAMLLGRHASSAAHAQAGDAGGSSGGAAAAPFNKSGKKKKNAAAAASGGSPRKLTSSAGAAAVALAEAPPAAAPAAPAYADRGGAASFEDSDDEVLWDGGEGAAAAAANNIVPAAPLLTGRATADGAAADDGTDGGTNGRCAYRCLVLDSAYRPINTVSWFKAVVMDLAGKVDAIDYYDAYAHSAHDAHPLPAVLRARRFVVASELAGPVSLTRRNVMTRDRFMCQYCGSARDLTLDHVVPVSRGGRNSWTNLVTACSRCNQRKGSAPLEALGWRLRGGAPREPTALEVGVVMGVSMHDLEHPPEAWAPYLEPFRERMHKARARALARFTSA